MAAVMAAVNVSSSGNSSDASVDAAVSSSNDTATSLSTASASTDSNAVGADGDLCSWYEDQSCAVPRACADCLDTLLPSGDACALDSTLGLCVPVSTISASAADDATARYYTAATYSYCSGEDAACAACRADWLQQFQSVGYVRASDAVCIGEGGCVCMAACVNPQWSTTVLSDQCSLFGGAFSRVMACIGIGGCILVLLVFVCACLRKWTREHDHPTIESVARRIHLGSSGQEQEEYRRRREAQLDVFYFRRFGRRRQRSESTAARGDRALALALPAWSSMREALIESEKQRDQRTETPVRLARSPSIEHV